VQHQTDLKMNDFELDKWNLRFCPQCGGHLHFRVTKSDTGQKEFSMVCYNTDTKKCDFKKVLSISNISDNDRHKIIEDYFGYNKPFQLTKQNWENSLLRYLFFENTSDFVNWLFQQIIIQKSLDHNNLIVASPYPHIIRGLSKFLYDNYLNEFIDQLKVAYSTTDNYHKFDSYLHLSSYQARELFIFRDIEKEFPEIKLSMLFNENDQTVKKVIETLCNKISSSATWTTFFKLSSPDQLFLGLKTAMNLYQVSKASSLKTLVQSFYTLIKERQGTSDEVSDIAITELTDWILSTTDQTDLPFTTTNYSAKSTQEYLLRLNLDREIKSTLNSEQSALETEKMKLSNHLIDLSSELTAIQNQIGETNVMLASKEKAIDRFKELKTFTGLNSISRLRKIIDSEKPIFYFPDILFKDAINVLEQLDQTEKEKLNVKLKTAKKGLLKELKTKLDTTK
jgi:hypothetical protein